MPFVVLKTLDDTEIMVNTDEVLGAKRYHDEEHGWHTIVKFRSFQPEKILEDPETLARVLNGAISECYRQPQAGFSYA